MQYVRALARSLIQLLISIVRVIKSSAVVDNFENVDIMTDLLNILSITEINP